MARVTSPRFVGREVEMEALADALARLQDDRPAVFVVGGEAGVGKSRLMAEVTEHARQSGVTVLEGGCIELAGSGLPFAPITEALRGLLRGLDDDERVKLIGDRRRELSSLLPELGTIEGSSVGGESVDHVPALMFESFLGLLEQLGKRAPVLLIIEDLHWSDDSTRDLLAFVVHNLRTERVMLCLTYRNDELHRRHPLKGWLARYQREAVVVRLELSSLGNAETVEQVAGILGERPDDALMSVLTARSDGNPLFTEELVAASRADVEGGLSLTLVDLLVSRVEALSERSQELMRIASAGGGGVDQTLLAEVGGFPEDELDDSLREAVEHHVLIVDPGTGRYSFRHALMREVVHDQMLPGERTRVHAAFAEALSNRVGGDTPSVHEAAELAHHWYNAHELARALSSSIEAGLAAERVYAFHEALQHFERALELWDRVPGADDLGSLDIVSTQDKAAYAAYQSGDPVRAAALLESAVEAATGDGEREAVLLYQLGRVQRWGLGNDDAGIESQQRAVELWAGGKPSGTSVRSFAELAAGLALVGRVDEALEMAERALALAPEAGDPAAQGQAHNSIGVVLGFTGDIHGAYDHILESFIIVERLGDPDDIGRAYINLSDALMRLGRFNEAAEKAIDGAALMRRLGHEYTHGHFLLGNACESYIPLGRWDEVESLTSEILSSKSDRKGNELFALFLRATVRLRRGDLDRARQDLDYALRLAEVMSQVQMLAPVRALQAELALNEGRPDDAAAVTREALEVVGQAPLDETNLVCLLMRAQADRGELARAPKGGVTVTEIVEEGRALLEGSKALFSEAPLGKIPGYHASCRAELTRLEGGSDPELWSDAARIWKELGCPYEAAYAHWRLGEALLSARSGRPRAGEALRVAHSHATKLGAAPLLSEIEGLARRARIDLAPEEAGPRPTTGDRMGLTPRELEVLELIAAGMTNPQIAEKLFISAKTAGIHVSHILTKLGVNGRVEAATLAQRLGLVGTDPPSSGAQHAER